MLAVSCGDEDKKSSGNDASSENGVGQGLLPDETDDNGSGADGTFVLALAVGKWTSEKQSTFGDFAGDEEDEMSEEVKSVAYKWQFELVIKADGTGTFSMKMSVDENELRTALEKAIKEQFPTFTEEQVKQTVDSVVPAYREQFNSEETSEISIEGNKIKGVTDSPDEEPGTLAFKGANLVMYAPDSLASETPYNILFPISFTKA